MTDTLGTGLLSFVETLFVSRRLALSNSLPDHIMFGWPRPQASPSGCTHSHCVRPRPCFWPSSNPALLERAAQHGNGDHVYKCASHHGSVCSRRLFYTQLRSFWSLSVSVVRSREVVCISEVNPLTAEDVYYIIWPNPGFLRSLMM